MARRNVYLPKWQRWYFTPMMVIVWGIITYQEYFNPANTDKLGFVGWLLMTILFLGLGGMLWAMSSGRLAAYEIEDER